MFESYRDLSMRPERVAGQSQVLLGTSQDMQVPSQVKQVPQVPSQEQVQSQDYDDDYFHD